MPVDEILEAATMGEEVATMEETVASDPVDLSTVSRQLDQIIFWQCLQFCLLSVLLGCLVGLSVAKAWGRVWR